MTVAAVLIAAVSPLAAQEAHHAKPVGTIGANETFAAQMDRAMERMHVDMAAIAPSGDPIADFLRMMIPHHQGAVDMAALVLLHTQDPRIRNLAQSIVTEQRYEIQLMERMLAAAVPVAQSNKECNR